MCHRLVVVLIFFPLVLTHRGRSFFQDVNDVSRTSTFDDEWVVETSGGSSAAHQLAQAMGYKITGEVLELFLHLYSNVLDLRWAVYPTGSRLQRHVPSEEIEFVALGKEHRSSTG